MSIIIGVIEEGLIYLQSKTQGKLSKNYKITPVSDW